MKIHFGLSTVFGILLTLLAIGPMQGQDWEVVPEESFDFVDVPNWGSLPSVTANGREVSKLIRGQQGPNGVFLMRLDDGTTVTEELASWVGGKTFEYGFSLDQARRFGNWLLKKDGDLIEAFYQNPEMFDAWKYLDDLHGNTGNASRVFDVDLISTVATLRNTNNLGVPELWFDYNRFKAIAVPVYASMTKAQAADHIKRQYQKVFQVEEKATIIFDINPDYFMQFSLPNGDIIENRAKLKELADLDTFWEHDILNFVKVK